MTISFLKYYFLMDNLIYIDGIPVLTVFSFKLLGLLLGNGPSWSDHVDSVIKKANSRLYTLRQLKRLDCATKILLPYILLSSGLRFIHYLMAVSSRFPIVQFFKHLKTTRFKLNKRICKFDEVSMSRF